MKTFRSTSRKRRNGTAKIQRASYNTIGGLHKKGSWWEVSEMVRKRNGGMCEGRNCKNKGSQVHHIIPLRAGGTNTPSNFIHLCKSCHAKRHTHMGRFL